MVWLVNTFARVIMTLILLRVIGSWLAIDRRSRPWVWLRLLTEPFLKPFRRLAYLRGMQLDPSPLLAVIALEILRAVLVWMIG